MMDKRTQEYITAIKALLDGKIVRSWGNVIPKDYKIYRGDLREKCVPEQMAGHDSYDLKWKSCGAMSTGPTYSGAPFEIFDSQKELEMAVLR